MIRHSKLYVSSDHHHRLRLAARLLDLSCPEEALELLIEQFLPSLVDVQGIIDGEKALIDAAKAKLKP